MDNQNSGNERLPQSKAQDKKDVAKRGKTLTGQPAQKIELYPKDQASELDKGSMNEEKEKTAVFTFGRFNPPTVGHEKLINKVHDIAKEHSATGHVFASHSENTSKDPLPQKTKIKHLMNVAPNGVDVHGSSKEAPSFLHAAKKLHDAGHKHLVMVAGSDRVEDYQKKLNQYNGKEGHYNFKSIKVVSAGQRDPDAEGVEGMSGTKMRSLARSGKMKEFKSGLPKALHSHADEIANHIRSVKEEVELSEISSKLVRKARDIAFSKGKEDQGHRLVKRAYDKQKKESDIEADKMSESAFGFVMKQGTSKQAYLGSRMQCPVCKKPGQKNLFKVVNGKEMCKDCQDDLKENVELDERVIDLQQRRKRALLMKRLAPKLKRARAIAANRVAGDVQLKRRVRKLAKNILRRRFAGKRGSLYQGLAPSDKLNIDKTIDAKVKMISGMATKLLPRVRQAEIKRYVAHKQHKRPASMNKQLGTLAMSTEYDFDTLISEMYTAVNNRIDITPECFGSLFDKAQKTNLEFETILEMYTEGYENSIESKLTREQQAFNYLNSQLANLNEAAQTDKELTKAVTKNINTIKAVTDKPSTNTAQKQLEKGKIQGFKAKFEAVQPDQAPVKHTHEVTVQMHDPLANGPQARIEKKVRVTADSDEAANERALKYYSTKGIKKAIVKNVEALKEDASSHLRAAANLDKQGKSMLAGLHRKIAAALTRGDKTTAFSVSQELKQKKAMGESAGAGFEATDKLVKNYKKDTPGQDMKKDINEVSLRTLKSYKQKAADQASQLNKAVSDVATSSAAPDHKKAAIDALVKKGNKRFSGILKATNKEFAKSKQQNEWTVKYTDPKGPVAPGSKTVYDNRPGSSTADSDADLKKYQTKSYQRQNPGRPLPPDLGGPAWEKRNELMKGKKYPEAKPHNPFDEQKDDLPFVPNKDTKKKAVAGKHGYEYSLVKHLARQALQKQATKGKNNG